jgi:hypothetical protein
MLGNLSPPNWTISIILMQMLQFFSLGFDYSQQILTVIIIN